MVGGSGLYVEAVLRGYRIPVAPPDDSRRRGLMRREKGELIDELRRRSPELAAATDCNSKRRVVRALEVALHAGDAPFERSAPPPVRIEHSVVALDLPAAELERRIDERLEARLEAGMIEEVERLLAAGVSHERMEQLGLEYREIGAYLAGGQTREAMVESLRRGIRRLAKRQRTWFRGMPRRGVEVRWVEPAAVVDTLVSLRRRP
jgi:tRNA dimethylallyltransferase